jgi:hypothetical protein
MEKIFIYKSIYKQGGRASPCSISWEHAHWETPVFHCSVHVHECRENLPGVVTLKLQTLVSKQICKYEIQE